LAQRLEAVRSVLARRAQDDRVLAETGGRCRAVIGDDATRRQEPVSARQMLQVNGPLDFADPVLHRQARMLGAEEVGGEHAPAFELQCPEHFFVCLYVNLWRCPESYGATGGLWRGRRCLSQSYSWQLAVGRVITDLRQ
jgi:hypothetical protein